MGDYQAIFAYFGVTLIVFVAGLLWYKLRARIKRHFNLDEYRRAPSGKADSDVGDIVHSR